MKKTSLRGDSAVLLTASKFTEAGITVLQPISECLKFDLVIFDGLTFQKVQVKRAYKTKNQEKFEISLRSISMTSKGPKVQFYSEQDVDFIIGVVMETDDLYCFPINVLLKRSAIRLNPNNVQNKFSKHKFINAEEFKNKLLMNNTIYLL